MNEKLKVLDLFSGIGGFSLGLERTGGFETVAFCEIGEFPRKVLAKHWPGVPIFDDVRSLTGEQFGPVDVICGGFPCQDISTIGSGRGLDGARSGLWFEYARIIGEVGPRWVIIENSPALRSRGLSIILQNLCEIGFDAEWHCIPASHVGAPHQRDRIWIVAYPTGIRREQGNAHKKRCITGITPWAKQRPWDGSSDMWRWAAESGVCGVDYVVPNRVHRIDSIGNAVVPEIPEIIGRAILEAEKCSS